MFRLERSDAWGEATPHYQRIKIRCCDMGRGYASLYGVIWGEATPLCLGGLKSVGTGLFTSNLAGIFYRLRVNRQ